MTLQVLCQVDATDGNPAFDLNEVASRSEVQMTAVLQTVSAHLNSLDKQFHAEMADAGFGELLQVTAGPSTAHPHLTSTFHAALPCSPFCFKDESACTGCTGGTFSSQAGDL